MAKTPREYWEQTDEARDKKGDIEMCYSRFAQQKGQQRTNQTRRLCSNCGTAFVQLNCFDQGGSHESAGTDEFIRLFLTRLFLYFECDFIS